MGMAAVYGAEDPVPPDANTDCSARLSGCQAKCCIGIMALTREEVAQGKHPI